MFCNATVTLYHDLGNGGYSTTVFERAFWSERKNNITSRDGLTRTDGIYLAIPTTEPLNVTDKDFFVKGKGAAIDNTNDETIAAGLKALGKVHGIASIREKLYGSPAMQHYEFDLR